MIVWRLRGKLSELFCAVLCNTTVHNHMYTAVSSSYRRTVLGLDLCVYVFLLGSVCVRLVILCLIKCKKLPFYNNV